jgi:hypothetical protein
MLVVPGSPEREALVLKLRYFTVAKRRQHVALGVSPRDLRANIPLAAKRRQQFGRDPFAVAASRLRIPFFRFPWAYAQGYMLSPLRG